MAEYNSASVDLGFAGGASFRSRRLGAIGAAAMNDASPAQARFADGVAFVDGDYVPIAEAKLPLMDYGFLRSDACQDTISVWKGQYFRREDHLDRFERSCQRLRFTSPHSRAEIRDVLDRCCALTGFEDAYLQMIMTRGCPPICQRDIRKATNR